MAPIRVAKATPTESEGLSRAARWCYRHPRCRLQIRVVTSVRVNEIPEVGSIIAGKYEVERVLGSGGMGVVVAARHIQLDQRVAIKFLRADAAARSGRVARFLREAQAAVALKSEHVARVLDVGTLERAPRTW